MSLDLKGQFDLKSQFDHKGHFDLKIQFNLTFHWFPKNINLTSKITFQFQVNMVDTQETVTTLVSPVSTPHYLMYK